QGCGALIDVYGEAWFLDSRASCVARYRFQPLRSGLVQLPPPPRPARGRWRPMRSESGAVDAGVDDLAQGWRHVCECVEFRQKFTQLPDDRRAFFSGTVDSQ